jgi:hypothetical protein
MIEECLRKSLKHIDLDQDIQTASKQTKNIVCHTKVNNGINIKLTFDFQEQRWECSLYKSFVDSLAIQFEKCTETEKNSKPIEEPQTNNEEEVDDEEEDDEAKIDEINQEIKNKDQDDDDQLKDSEEDVDDENDNKNQNDADLDEVKDKDEENNRPDDDVVESDEDKNPDQNNLGLGGSNQNVNSNKGINQNSQGRQSNAGLDHQGSAMTNVGNQDEDEDDSNEKQLNPEGYDQVEADEYSNKKFNFAGKNHEEAEDDDDGDDIPNDA